MGRCMVWCRCSILPGLVRLDLGFEEGLDGDGEEGIGVVSDRSLVNR